MVVVDFVEIIIRPLKKWLISVELIVSWLFFILLKKWINFSATCLAVSFI